MSTVVPRLLLAALCVLLSCEAVPLGDGPRRRMVHDVAADVVVPTTVDFAARAEALRGAVVARAADPARTTRGAAQAAWRAARAPWMEAQAVRQGPVRDRLLEAKIDQVVDPARVAEVLAGTGPVDQAAVAALGANRKGFHALELLLFAGGDGAVLAALTDAATGARRREFLVGLASDLAARAAELRDAWSPDGDDYLTTFTDVGGDGAAFATIKPAVDAIVNDAVSLAELMADGKLGKPLGEAGVPRPELEESGPSDHSLDDLLANLRGLRAVVDGGREASGQGLGALVAARSPALAARLRGELAAAEAAVQAIPRPFRQALLDGAPEVPAAFEACKALHVTLATEVVAALGATLSFNDNDGD